MCIGVIGVVMVLFAGASAFFWLQDNWWNKEDTRPAPSDAVGLGDSVEIEYTAFFMEDPNGPYGAETVFETTMIDVAHNDSFPKSLTFDILHKDTSTQYSSKTITVGENQITKGLDNGIIGMKKNDRKTFTVSPGDAYGNTDPALVYHMPRIQEVPLYETLNITRFTDLYPMESNARVGTGLVHYFWKWPVTVIAMDNDSVTLENAPEFGNSYRPLSWNITVRDISTKDGQITISHDTQQALNSVVPVGDMTPLDQVFISNVEYPGIVSLVGDELLIDFNYEAVGEYIRYEVTVISIEK